MVGERGIVGRDRAGVGKGTEIFARIKTHAGGVAEGTGLFAAAAGAVGLRGVFEDEEVVLGGDGVDRDLERLADVEREFHCLRISLSITPSRRRAASAADSWREPSRRWVTSSGLPARSVD